MTHRLPLVNYYSHCPRCGGPAEMNWFDRSLCQCDGTDWGVMHTRCQGCGFAFDGCAFETPVLMEER